ncbi:type II toxin-antitoxin system VapC family toxin [Plantibacter sp. PA-3-X8]|uniref:type II toxin-antitoxin system VapC family toxin n=1 Tax=Plantibacter sp. PA-3-X8 TaxID=2480625 RepID=UPI000F5D8C5E|nr:type II toxin-antitoxin system VapC family toxin [Plantibacter sp. PA-3-X8]AZH81822.1 type II toxin-antitoxin system VapC family toxin [Plantibacter sp. PA-3-X8]
MIILDTNVVSELFRPRPDPTVARWLDRQDEADLHLTTMTAAELLEGALRLPAGARRSALVGAVATVLDADFAGRVLPFSAEAALDYAELMTTRRRSGNPIGPQDAIIAAIARSSNAALATRNTRDFAGVGLHLIDPWVPDHLA